MIHDLKTIAVTIDEETLGLLDRLTSTADRKRSRSALVRTAVREFAARERQRSEEARERELLRRHGRRLRAEAEALVREQAER
jgi:metal-responsive CopG/Arc/MetJ family transcriptional regulator